MIMTYFFNQIRVSLPFVHISGSYLLFLKKHIIRIKLHRLVSDRIYWLKSFHHNITLSVFLWIRIMVSEFSWALQIEFNMVSVHQNILLTSIVWLWLLNTCSISRSFRPLSSFRVSLQKASILHFKYADRSFFHSAFSFEVLRRRGIHFLFIGWCLRTILMFFCIMVGGSFEFLEIRRWMRAWNMQWRFVISVISAHFIYSPIFNFF